MLVPKEQADRLRQFCNALIDQERAHVIVEPMERSSGFWFGGGNMVEGPDGSLLTVGRFRNAGDSRTGVAAGTRGLELAIFRSTDKGQTFEKVVSWSKEDLNSPSGEVLSIEGSCLRFTSEGVELFVSTEKRGISYPPPIEDFLKPGAGVWTIDVLRAESLESLRGATVEPFLANDEPPHLHVKDPFFWPTSSETRLGFCSHPFGWSSSNTSVVDIANSATADYGVFPRGTTWDVAMTRGTCVIPIPRVGAFADTELSLLFYCGGECLRSLDEHSTAVKRPRGYSCEEIGGVAVIDARKPERHQRISDLLPMFISPYGTGCSRYVDVLATDDGFYATWQQSQDDLAQPLVLNFVGMDRATELLTV